MTNTTTRRDWKNTIIPIALQIVIDLTLAAAGVPPTLRQVYYQLLSAPRMLALPEHLRFRATDGDYDYLSERTAILRRKVVNPDTDERAFPRLSEEGTGIVWQPWYRDAAHALSKIDFRGNRYRDLLDANIFIGTEKAGILTQLEQWFGEPYHIPIYPLGGNGSQTKIDELIDYAVQARDIYERPNCFIYAGDFDAKGFDIERDFTERASRAFDPDHIIRVGMTLEQKRAHPEWWLRGKHKDTSVGAFFDRFGDDAYYKENEQFIVENGKRYRLPVQVELDALPPDVLRQAFLDEISRLTELPDVDGKTPAEREEQQKLRLLADISDRYSLDELRAL